MKYYRYFELFLNLEDQLCNYIRQIEYSRRSRDIYTPKISLLLLQACPIVESYMVQLCTRSETVSAHELYNWQYCSRLWEHDRQGQVRERNGRRSIREFPKFSYVCEKVFSLSTKTCRFYFSDKFHELDGADHYQELCPYKNLQSFGDHNNYDPNERAYFPVGLQTPKWWTAYNKIKHDLDEAERRVSYALAIEAIAALFVLLCSGDVEIAVLRGNGFVANNEIRTKLFAVRLP